MITKAQTKNITIIVMAIMQIMVIQLFLSSCGFQPRGSNLESMAGQQVSLISKDPYGSLERKIKSKLKASGINYLASSSGPEDKSSHNSIRILRQKSHRKVISVDEYGRPAEYENSIFLDVVFIFSDGSEQNRQLSVRRDYLYDSANSVAYDREETTILSEMHEDLSQRLVTLYLRQLSEKANP